MRLLITGTIALAISAVAQPALARGHYHHHGWRHVSHYRFAHDSFAQVRTPYRGAFRAERVHGAQEREGHGDLDSMIARHAAAEGVPEALVHRVVIRESRYHPHVVGRGGAMGLMQIKYSTARAMGYTGSPAGLLDPDTNLTYAVRYLAGAYHVAHGNSDRAVMNYARGYYAGAKREGFSPYQVNAGSSRSYASARPVERVAMNAPSGSDQQLAGR
jgi:soluble lytic murein transglycosylase-like protein